jgi:hypothetical protein
MSALDLVAPFTVRHLISTTFICKLAVNLQVFDSDSSAPLHNFLATFPASAGALTGGTRSRPFVSRKMNSSELFDNILQPKRGFINQVKL